MKTCSDNIVEYRKFIKKAEEEEETIREREERKLLMLKGKVNSITAQKEDISEDEVDEEKIPKLRKRQRENQRLTADAKTAKLVLIQQKKMLLFKKVKGKRNLKQQNNPKKRAGN